MVLLCLVLQQAEPPLHPVPAPGLSTWLGQAETSHLRLSQHWHSLGHGWLQQNALKAKLAMAKAHRSEPSKCSDWANPQGILTPAYPIAAHTWVTWDLCSTGIALPCPRSTWKGGDLILHQEPTPEKAHAVPSNSQRIDWASTQRQHLWEHLCPGCFPQPPLADPTQTRKMHF